MPAQVSLLPFFNTDTLMYTCPEISHELYLSSDLDIDDLAFVATG
jgi:hypothetical protein